MLLILAAVLIAGAIVAAILLTRGDNKNSTTTTVLTTSPVRTTPASAVPVAVTPVVGQSATTATAALKSSGLRVATRNVPGPPPAGRVLAQSPSPGRTMRRGGLVTLNVSDGSKTSTAPAKPATTPQATTTTPQATTTTPQATTPQATTTAPQQTTTAPQATTTTETTTPAATPPQPRTVDVPSLSGQGQVKGAVQQLASAGLLASVQYVPGDDPLGTVTAQSPAGGASAKTGSHVTLSVSSGPGGNPMETVPDTTGQRIPQAVQTLNRAGLRLILLRRTVSDQSQAGTVVDQTPKAGAHAPKNAQVVVYMGAYRQG
jgi:eukaryotic-like serine/threonine-protein kinase